MLACYSEGMALVLNQYRAGSAYKDSIGDTYHFPSRYLNRFQQLPISFAYYEPRVGGEQVYFGAGVITAIAEDTEESGHFYADIDGYAAFTKDLSYFGGPSSSSWEPAKTMRNSVRDISDNLFSSICQAGNITTPIVANTTDHVGKLQRHLARLTFGRGTVSKPQLRKIRRILETYERPTSITTNVKETRGSTCQICGYEGFLKRKGKRYCEVHHLFHLSDNPPVGCLEPEYLAVVCATCHRRLHYGNVETPPKPVPNGWTVTLDGIEYCIETGRQGLNVDETIGGPIS